MTCDNKSKTNSAAFEAWIEPIKAILFQSTNRQLKGFQQLSADEIFRSRAQMDFR